jgi:hypothetical protein
MALTPKTPFPVKIEANAVLSKPIPPFPVKIESNAPISNPPIRRVLPVDLNPAYTNVQNITSRWTPGPKMKTEPSVKTEPTDALRRLQMAHQLNQARQQTAPAPVPAMAPDNRQLALDYGIILTMNRSAYLTY